ncbi:hypothetical protein TorRG33x02_316220, partial [Trema orientale]
MGTDFMIRDHSRSVIATGTKYYPGDFSVENAELMALQDGLLYAHLHGLNLLSGECDALK